MFPSARVPLVPITVTLVDIQMGTLFLARSALVLLVFLEILVFLVFLEELALRGTEPRLAWRAKKGL